MTDEVILVDARGHKCPVPSLRLRKAMEGKGPGTVFVLLATDPMARIDVPYLMAELGGRVIGIERLDDGLEIRVESGDGRPD